MTEPHDETDETDDDPQPGTTGVFRVERRWVIVGVTAFVVAMVPVYFTARHDFWQAVLPGYLTGAGTLALGFVAYRTMVQEAVDRRRLEADARQAREDEKRERKRADAAEKRERDAQERRLRRHQAERIQVLPVSYNGGTELLREFFVSAVNGSADAITDVVFYLGALPIGFVNPDPSLAPIPIKRIVRVVAGQTVDWGLQVAVNGSLKTASPVGRAWLFFTDANGVRWARDPDHTLIETTTQYERDVYEAVVGFMVTLPAPPA